MKRLLVAVMLLALGAGSGLTFAGTDWTGCNYVPGELLVDFNERVGPALYDLKAATLDETVAIGVPSVDALLARYHVRALSRIASDEILSKIAVTPDAFRSVTLEFPPETDIFAMIAEFERDPHVNFAEPNLLHRTFDHIPNDPMWGSQWDKDLMNCPVAWEFSIGTREIQVVAVDGGTWWRHVDYYDNLWVNPGEDINGDGVAYTDTTYPGDQNDLNGVDDDGNGMVDDFIGWDFLRNQSGCAPGEDCDGQRDNDPTSVGDHGTHVLGLMGAVGDNNIGVTGVNWNVRIMASRSGYATPDGNGLIVSNDAVACMYWAVAHGVDIINMSYGSSYGGSMEANALAAAWNNGVIPCGAAGNDHVQTPHYPANHPYVVAVGSTDDDDGVSYFSNYGTWLDVFSPGNMVMSTVIPGYASYPGTSMASPNAAGVFALLWSIFPDMTNAELVEFVLDNCEDITAENPDYNPGHLGSGRIDAMLPLRTVFPYLTLESFAQYGDNDQDGRLEPGETGSLTLTLHNDADWQAGLGVQVVVTTDDPNLTLVGNTLQLGDIAPGSSVENADNPVQVTVASGVTDAYWSTINLQITGGNGYSQTYSFILRIGRPATLVVADDGVQNFHNFYTAALMLDAMAGYNHDLWSVAADGDPVLADVSEYDHIIWVCGNDSTTTLSAENQTMLGQFLDAGNNLLLAGQGIEDHIGDQPFFASYLHSQRSTTGTPGRIVAGVAGDPISDGTSLLLLGGGCGGNGTIGPDLIEPANGGVGFYTYQAGGTGAIRFEGSYKTAFFAFALEAACGSASSTHHRVVIQNVMEWFGAPVSDVEPTIEPVAPAAFSLKPNYPNPFNPSTTIAFELERNAMVTLRVYDMLGREVATLLNGPATAGSHAVQFDGTALASGVYLAHLSADGHSATQRMLLLK